ncbi:hypothetical protein PGUG_03937 [Meyerozyma guilliermondii ATCC 6260]|uniref:Uncharacterized protein n=1 Tax=Meyerozyma guilliermondii (strain ATCC 6260 / CBS 566 / DSM 6381 / JCM 1539 / NBRC 10279 / NRRL Y-324) TaxID=294746 RepID=A5DKY6_PICGU|nr:uncharacterized protein PGUG_03937 [Meyerozyma guilliermondii ATCC 6260]EDK39839.2 hypothetical protein PGUG_03937 [Meyerozyma guilliermondii ATCC 6260]
MKPFESKKSAVQIIAFACIYCDFGIDSSFYNGRLISQRPIDDNYRLMHSTFKVLHSPLHSCRKVVSIGSSPAPNCSLVTYMCLVIFSQSIVDGIRIMSRSSSIVHQNIATTPASIIGTIWIVEAIWKNKKCGRCVTLHDEHWFRIHFSKRSHTHDIGFKPLFGYQVAVWSTFIKKVVSFARNPHPC